MKAVLPAAGRGLRMASTTAGLPKELLQVAGREVLLWGLEEALQAGVEGVVVITSPSKPEIAGFLNQAELSLPVQTEVQYEPNGLGHAVSLVGVENDVLVILPDTIFYPQSPSKRVAAAIKAGADMSFAIETVSDAEVPHYGILKLDLETNTVLGIVEKPSLGEAPSRSAIAGRVGLSRRMMEFLDEFLAAQDVDGSEQGWTPAFNAAIVAGLSAVSVPIQLDEQRFDCGSPVGYSRARSFIKGSPALE